MPAFIVNYFNVVAPAGAAAADSYVIKNKVNVPNGRNGRM